MSGIVGRGSGKSRELRLFLRHPSPGTILTTDYCSFRAYLDLDFGRWYITVR